jgi:hypothetical protein
MESHWASEHLQVIRTLMERSAVYRRALAPVTLTAGIIGIAAGAVGWWQGWDSSRAFGLYWGIVSLVAVSICLILVRFQALRDREPFWSPPTRRVSQAMLPALFAGWITIVAIFLPRWSDTLQGWWLPCLWMIFYGCAIHAAGFFMPRGIKLFGWMFVLAGCALFLALSRSSGVPPMRWCHLFMGATFGGLHCAYGAYLYLTEKGAE